MIAVNIYCNLSYWYWAVVGVVLIYAVRDGGPSLSRIVCVTMLLCLVAGLLAMLLGR